MTSQTPSLILVRYLLFSCCECFITLANITDSEKPEEWDDEEDGDWIAPSIRNPKCDDAPGCGEWKR